MPPLPQLPGYATGSADITWSFLNYSFATIDSDIMKAKNNVNDDSDPNVPAIISEATVQTLSRYSCGQAQPRLFRFRLNPSERTVVGSLGGGGGYN